MKLTFNHNKECAAQHDDDLQSVRIDDGGQSPRHSEDHRQHKQPHHRPVYIPFECLIDEEGARVKINLHKGRDNHVYKTEVINSEQELT